MARARRRARVPDPRRVPHGPRERVDLGGLGEVAHRRGRNGLGSRRVDGSGRSSPQPRSSSSRGSRSRSTPEEDERCSACRSVGRGGCSGRGAGHDRPPLRLGRARRGRRCVPERCGPSPRSADPDGHPVSWLGLLADRAVDGGTRDERGATDTVLRRRRRRDRPLGTGNRIRRCRVRPGRDDGSPSGGARHRRGRGRRGGGRGGHGRRGRRGQGALRQRVATLPAEECALGAHLAAVRADRHAARKANSYLRPSGKR